MKDFASGVDGSGSRKEPDTDIVGDKLYLTYNLHESTRGDYDSDMGDTVYSFYLRFVSSFEQDGERLMFGYAQTRDEAKGTL